MYSTRGKVRMYLSTGCIYESYGTYTQAYAAHIRKPTPHIYVVSARHIHARVERLQYCVWWCDTVYDDVTQCMMMWHCVWWCDTVCMMMWHCMLMWHCVWWCDTVYDDVTLCTMWHVYGDVTLCMMMWHMPRAAQNTQASCTYTDITSVTPTLRWADYFFCFIIIKEHLSHSACNSPDYGCDKKTSHLTKKWKKMKSPDYGGVVARVHLRVALQWAPGFRAWGPRKRASTMSRTCDYMYVCMYVQACSPGVFPGRVPSHPVDGEPFTFQKRPYWTQGLEFNLRHFSRERTH